MNVYLRYLFFLFIATILYLPSKATHLIGADMTYECLGGNVYEVTLNIYRDCGPNNTNGSGFDDDIFVKLYDIQLDTFSYFSASLDGNITDVNYVTTDPCLVIPDEMCIEKGSYYFEITVPDSTKSYMLNYQRCCFGANVNNIEVPEDMGINVSALIPASSFQGCYSSPTFNNDPLLAVCLANDLSEDLGASSYAGMPGNLEFSFFTPFAGSFDFSPTQYQELPFTEMVWSTGYSENYPIESNPAIALDSLTGQLSGTAIELGNFIMGTKVEVKDNANNVVAFVERVFKYTVADCSAGEHQVEIESDLGNNVQLCSGDQYTFEAAQGGTTDSLVWTINGDSITDGSTLTHAFSQDGTYNVVLHGLADSAECYIDGSYTQFVTVFTLDPKFTARTYICAGEENKFEDTTFIPAHITYEITDWLWNFGDGQTSVSENPLHTYTQPGIYDVTLQVTMDNGCVETITKQGYIEVYDVEVDIESITEICVNNPIQFNNALILPPNVTNPVTKYVWNFGDGTTSDEANPVHIYTSVGIYDVSLYVELATGCSYQISYPDHMTIFDDYVDVDLNIVTDTITFPFNNPLVIETTTNNFDSVAWSLDDVFVGNTPDLNYMIGEEYNGEYLEVFVEFFEGSCSISKQVHIPVTYTGDLFIPNAFTPNGDSRNDGFKPFGRVVDHADKYKFTIYNRFGQMYFNSTNKNEAWLGYSLDNEEVSQGIYVWTLDIVTKHSGKYSKTGVVTLIK